ncbi:MAG TPA: diguanylate cyclase [Thermomicrobiales bacterium]|nr:diguanylate cyclase [Thermomicrobiales bacterium]
MKSALLIERDATTRRSLELALALHGYIAVRADSARQLAALSAGRAFDLLIAGQPATGEGTPADACRAAREAPGLADIPLLVLSSPEHQDVIEDALRSGANGVLTHPIDDAQLRVRLSDLERGRAAPDSVAQPDADSPPAPAPSERYRVLVEQASGLMLIVEADGTIIWANPASDRVLDHDPEQLAGVNVVVLCHPDDIEPLALVLDAAAEHREAPAADLRFVRGDGVAVDLELRVVDLQEHPAVAGVVLLGHDVSERVQQERALRGRLAHDALTGLPNRLLFVEQAERTLARAERRNEPVVMVYIDLDDLQEVNQRHGREIVDDLLRAVAARLHRSMRANDTTARFGDDEFAILLDDMASEDDAAIVAERLLLQLAQPFELAEAEGVTSIVVTGSIGVAVSRPEEAAARVEAESRLADLLRRADAALSRAKQTGKARWVHADDLGTVG